ncbi:MAG: GntR family transcriptional regulator [Oscillospiraceae bacterium]|nr:GntR family transcriptional regulator [Oscillospiraceae bacterium]
MENYKYLSVIEWAKEYIKTQKLRQGDRFPSENELCGIHGVSRQTVRQALLHLESEGVISRVRGSGTFVKGGFSDEPKGPGSIGVISTYFSDYIFPYIVTGIEEVLTAAGYSMQLATTHNEVSEETQALENMIRSGVQGLIVEPSASALPNPNTELYREIKEKNIPLVFFNAKYPWSDMPCVAMDDEAAAKTVTDYLFECGHRRISGMFTFDDIQGHKRYSGFMKSCIGHGLRSPEKNVFWYAAAGGSRVFGLAPKRILELIESSAAVVCYNDKMAVDLLQFCKEQGISVPGDISVAGIDDSRYASICDVPLTTARHPHSRLGEAAARTLLDMIENRSLQHHDVIFTPELIVRDSVINLNKLRTV